ncbi:hypothetical protein FRZ61_20810 [Hypericibacter adhaerens]|uniref:Glycosyltransferase 2-like domain-containing protein n=1 Tax=Hypericibacter adhaerens TaxID=2602016 RepID=A0A5J6MXU9_9PROT|nr:glycosyltransferase family 39 protein [Hypericibacter adhaerens]QEX22151.1 hypothetical protein FRZ61_20810 [Hypericibacter adhaerens]
MEEPETGAKIAVIIPTLNEFENIDALLAAVLAQGSAERPLEVLVADGGSTDGTVECVRRWEERAPVRLVASKGRRGLAGDVLAAAERTQAPVIVVMDADFSHPPASLSRLVAPIIAGESDMVVGSRYVPGGLIAGWPWRRRILSRLGGALAWPLADLRDPMSGFFAVRRDRLLAVDPAASGFKIGLEVMAVGGDALGVGEVPIAFADRVRGTSKIGLRELAAYARRLMVLAGGSVSTGNAARFAGVAAFGFIVDLLSFHALFAAGLGLAAAHMASFGIAAISSYALYGRWAFAKPAGIRSASGWPRSVRFLVICALALFLRGGVLAVAVDVWGWPPALAMALAAATAAAVSGVATAFFVFPPLHPYVSRSVRWRMVAVAVLAYVVALRVVFMGVVDLLPEEAYYWNYAQHLDIGYLDHPPMVAWLIWLGTGLFGQTEFAVRLAAPLCWLAAALFSFGLARDLYGKTAAFIAVSLLAVLPFFFAMGLLMTPDAPLIAAWAGTLYFLERALLAERRKAWLGVGLCLGLGLLSKYTIALLAPAALVFLLLDARSRRWLRSPWPYLGAAIATLLFSPVVAWNAAHDWASFAFQGTRRLGAAPEFSLHLLAGSILLLITPVGVAAAFSILTPTAGLRQAFRRPFDRAGLFTAAFTLTPLSVFVAFSLFHPIKLNWTGPLWLALLPALAQMIAAGRHLVLFRRAPAWGATVAILLPLYGAGFHYLTLGLPGVPFPRNLQGLPVAWREFGDAAGGIERQVEHAVGQEPLLVGMDRYFLSSQLAFYGPDDDSFQNTAGRGLFGSSGLMYDYWFSDARQAGRTVIIFGFEPAPLSDDRLAKWFRELGPVGERALYKAGAPAGRFFYRVGYGYRLEGPSLISLRELPLWSGASEPNSQPGL